MQTCLEPMVCVFFFFLSFVLSPLYPSCSPPWPGPQPLSASEVAAASLRYLCLHFYIYADKKVDTHYYIRKMLICLHHLFGLVTLYHSQNQLRMQLGVRTWLHMGRKFISTWIYQKHSGFITNIPDLLIIYYKSLPSTHIFVTI